MYDRWIKRVYDADGAGSGAAETEHFVYDGNQIVLTLDESGSPTHRYLWGPAVDQLLAEEVLVANDPEAPGEVRWMLADHLGTIRDVALLEYVDDDPVTSIAAHLSYDSFGNRLNDAAIDLFFGYTGRAFDSATGLQYNTQRWLESATGGWLSEDPSGLDPDFNRYRYVGNGPTNATDPSGLDKVAKAWLGSEVSWTPEDSNGFNYQSIPIGSIDGDDVIINDEMGGGRVPLALLQQRALEMHTASSLSRYDGQHRDRWASNVKSAIQPLVGEQAPADAPTYGVLGFVKGAGWTAPKNVIVGIYEVIRHPLDTGRNTKNFIVRPYNEVETDVSHALHVKGAQLMASGEGLGTGFTEFLVLPVAGAVTTELLVSRFGTVQRTARIVDNAPNSSTTLLNMVEFMEDAAPRRSIIDNAAHNASVSVPRTAVAEAEGFIGPGIGRASFRTINEFGDAVFDRYQQFYDQGYAIAQRRVTSGRLANNARDIGSATDRYARAQLRRWLASEGIDEGAGGIIQVNRWLRDPTPGSSAYRIPDVRIPGANISLDGTIGWKSATTPQIRLFRIFSGGDNVIIVRPTQIGGSYGIIFP